MGSKRQPVIMHVVNTLEGGGTERMLVSLLRASDPARLGHVVVTLRAPGRLAANLPDHAACRPMEAVGRSLTTGLKLARLIRNCGADVIHARNTGCWNDAILAAVLTPRARLVLGFHGLETARPFDARQRRSVRRGLRAGARFATVSHAGRRQLHEQARVPFDRIDLLENGVDLCALRGPDERTRRRIRGTLHLRDEAFVVGIVGSLTPVKQHATLISAVARASAAATDIELLIVGDGPLRAELSGLAGREGVGARVHFTGWREDAGALMAAIDAYVCCSESEGMNNALLAAMAMGLPIVATDVGDNARMVRDAIEGIIVESRAPDALAEALRMLAHTPGLRERFAAAARVRARAFDLDRAVRRYQHYYEQLSGTRSVANGRAMVRRGGRHIAADRPA